MGDPGSQHEQHDPAQVWGVLELFELKPHHVGIHLDVGPAVEEVAVDTLLRERLQLLGQLVGHTL